MAIEVTHNKEISGGKKSGWENESVLLSIEEEQMGGVKSLSGGRNELWLFKHFVIKLALCCDLFLF